MTPFEMPEPQHLDPNCIFCKIVSASALPSDLRRRSGCGLPRHRRVASRALVGGAETACIRRRHGDGSLTEIAPAVDAVAKLLKQRLAATGSIAACCPRGSAAGQEVFHSPYARCAAYADEPGLRLLINPDAAPDGELESVYRQIQAGV